MEQLNNIIIKVFSASALTAADKKKIEEFFKGKHKGAALTFSYGLDASLLGGVKIVDGDAYVELEFAVPFKEPPAPSSQTISLLLV